MISFDFTAGNVNLDDCLNFLIKNFTSYWQPAMYSTEEYTKRWKNEALPLIDVCSKTAGFFSTAISKINSMEENIKQTETLKQYDAGAEAKPEEKKNTDAKAVGTRSSELLKSYDNAFILINKYKTEIEANRLPNSNNMIAWLDNKIGKYISDEKSNFEKIDNSNKEYAIDPYIKRLNIAIEKLQEFAKKVNIGV